MVSFLKSPSLEIYHRISQQYKNNDDFCDSMQDVFGAAIKDYHHGQYTQDIIVRSTLSDDDIIPLPYLFRTFDQMPELERIALQHCKGEILDVGCGAGSHALYLQEKKFLVTAIDVSKGAIEVCKNRKLNALQQNIYDFNSETYDTILLLMNGLGIAKNLKTLPKLLKHLKSLLKKGGQILLDSSDIIFLYDQLDDGSYSILIEKDYYGEMKFEIFYKNISQSVSWLYVDKDTLLHCAAQARLSCEIIFEGDHYEYLAKLM